MNSNTATQTNIVRVASGINFLLAIWLFVSPWVYGAAGNPNAWNSWIVGVFIAIAAAVRYSGALGTNVVNIVLGVWVFFSPWIFGYTGNTGRFVNSLCVGVAVIVLAAISHRRVSAEPMYRH